VILLCGGTGELITKDGRSVVNDDPEGLEYPWKPLPFKEIIYMGSGKLVDNKGTDYDPDFALKNKYTGVFFSGHWVGIFEQLNLSLETRLDTSPDPKPGYNHHVRPENRPKCKH
jgi:hypothetical protein